MYAVVQIGSRIARFECGTMRRTLGSPCAVAVPAPAARIAATAAAAAMRDMVMKNPSRGRRRTILLLADVPVEVARADHQSLDALAHCGRGNVFAQGRMRPDLECTRLDLLGELLLRGFVGRAREAVAQLLEVGVARPAEPALVARAAHGAARNRIPH